MLLGGVIVQGSGGHGRAYREAMGVLRASVEGVKTYKFDHPSSNETLVFSFHWDRSHHFIPEILKGIEREYLGKEVRHILLGVHMYWDDNVFVPELLDPLLANINMLETSLEGGVLAKDFRRGVVHFKFHRLWELGCLSETHLIDAV